MRDVGRCEAVVLDEVRTMWGLIYAADSEAPGVGYDAGAEVSLHPPLRRDKFVDEVQVPDASASAPP